MNTQLKVSGMTCGGCESTVVRNLLKIDGVEAVTASHETGDVNVETESSDALEAAKERITELGYALA